MDLLQTVIGFCGTVSQTDTEYKLLSQRLSYELKKAEHLLSTQKVKSVPKFMLDNLRTKILQARQHLQKIQSLLKQNQLPLRQKIKLSLPFNKTSKQVNTAVQALQKAQQDVIQYSSNSSDSQNHNGKRPIDNKKTKAKREQTMVTIMPSEVDEEDMNEALMGPTIEEDVAIQFTKNKYVLIEVEICGNHKIINLIKEIDPDFLVYRDKIQIKFDSTAKNDVEYLELFSLGRLHFKPIYAKLKTVWADVDRISKQAHFVIKLKRFWQNTEEETKPEQKSQKKIQENGKHENKDEFFSFPATDQVLVKRQMDVIVVQRAHDKNLFIVDETGMWIKLNDIERELVKGDQIAPCMPLNVNPLKPDLYFKVNYHVLE